MRLSLAWRLIAAATLIIYAVLAFFIIWIVVHNLAFAILLAGTAALLVYSGWLLVSGSGNRLKAGWLLTLGIVALAIEIIYFIRNISDIWALLLVAILSIVYVGLANALRRQYWQAQRQAAQTHTHFHHPFLIINPKSGNGRAIKAHIDRLAKQQDIQVLMLQKGDDVELMARQAVKAGADVLGISGGDGSIGAVAKVALEHDLPIVVLPGGTRCHFARDLGLDPEHITDALAGFTGVARQVDVGSINGRIFLNNVSFGMYADIVDRPGYRENKLQVSRIVLHEIVTGKKDRYDLQFAHNNQQFQKAVQVLVGVNAYTTLNVFELGQREHLNEGVLQVTAITKLDDAMVKRLMATMMIGNVSQHRETPDFYQWETKHFQITSLSGTIIAGVDGEREVYKAPVTISVKPAALEIYVPAEGIRSRPKNALSLFMFKQLWRAASPKKK